MSFFNEDFPWNCAKKPIPTCHEWRVWSHFSMNLSIKLSNKKLVSYIPCTNHTMSFFNGNFHEIAKKNTVPTCHEWRVWFHFSMNLSIKFSNKKLVTYIPCTNHAMSFFNENFCTKQFDIYMPLMKSMISFFNASFHKIIKQKVRYLHTVHKACDVIFQWKFSMKLREKTRYLHAMNEEYDLIFQCIFP